MLPRVEILWGGGGSVDSVRLRKQQTQLYRYALRLTAAISTQQDRRRDVVTQSATDQQLGSHASVYKLHN
jgi:hypothetical protein